MTEDEAKTKWCPMVRSATLITGVDYHETAVGGAGCNRAHPNMMFEGANCIASDCMMFRKTFCPECNTMSDVEKHGCNNTHFYCGLGGSVTL